MRAGKGSTLLSVSKLVSQAGIELLKSREGQGEYSNLYRLYRRKGSSN